MPKTQDIDQKSKSPYKQIATVVYLKTNTDCHKCPHKHSEEDPNNPLRVLATPLAKTQDTDLKSKSPKTNTKHCLLKN